MSEFALGAAALRLQTLQEELRWEAEVSDGNAHGFEGEHDYLEIAEFLSLAWECEHDLSELLGYYLIYREQFSHRILGTVGFVKVRGGGIDCIVVCYATGDVSVLVDQYERRECAENAYVPKLVGTY